MRRRTWLAVSLPLLLWMAVVWRIACAGLFVPGRGVPGIPLAVLLPLLVGLPLLPLRSATLAAVLDAVEPSWLVGFQVYRVLGAVFLVRWASGALLGAFALPAGIGDVLVGTPALPVALWLRSGARGGSTAAAVWNVLGIADLAVALTLGFLSSPHPFQIIALDHPNRNIATYPLVMIPTFAVPPFHSPARLVPVAAGAAPAVWRSGTPPSPIRRAAQPRSRARAPETTAVLIHGATGSAGLFAVQLAHRYGAHVIATTSGRTTEFVRQLWRRRSHRLHDGSLRGPRSRTSRWCLTRSAATPSINPWAVLRLASLSRWTSSDWAARI